MVCRASHRQMRRQAGVRRRLSQVSPCNRSCLLLADNKLSPRQKAQLAWLETLPPKMARLTRAIELMQTQMPDDTTLRATQRLLDELKAQASTLGVTALGDTIGIMGTLLRRTGGTQMTLRYFVATN